MEVAKIKRKRIALKYEKVNLPVKSWQGSAVTSPNANTSVPLGRAIRENKQH